MEDFSTLHWKTLATVAAMLSFGGLAHGATIILGGVITQSTADTSVPAVQNLSLNNIADGDTYSILIGLSGGIGAPGAYSLTNLVFTDPAANATESGFVSGSLTITAQGATDMFDVLGCLPSCGTGNQLALEFSIPAAKLTSAGAASPVPSLLPMDLLEDDGGTDIHGALQAYTYLHPDGGNPVPEPATLWLAGGALLVRGSIGRRRARR